MNTQISTAPKSYLLTDSNYIMSTRPTITPLGSYNNNIPSPIVDPTPTVQTPLTAVKPTTASVDIQVPAPTSQITTRPTNYALPESTNTGIVPPASELTSKNMYLWIGLGIIAVIVIFILLKKYKKI